MKKISEAAKISAEKWFDEIPENIPDVKFSAEHEEKMKKLFSSSKKKHAKRTLGTVRRTLLVAIIAVTALIVTVSGGEQHDYAVEDRYGKIVYTIENPYDGKVDEDLISGYVPKGYVLAESNCDENGGILTYKNESEMNNDDYLDFYQVQKLASVKELAVGFEKDVESIETVTSGGYEYRFVRYTQGNSLIFWNNGKYQYRIWFYYVDLTQEEMLAIARNIK